MIRLNLWRDSRGAFVGAFLVAVIVLVHRLDDFTGIRYVTQDDIEFSVGWYQEIQPGSPAALGIEDAKSQGRLHKLVGVSIYSWVLGLRSPLLYDVISLGSFILAVVLVTVCVSMFSSRWFAVLYALALTSLLPQLWNHLPPAAFPVSQWTPLILFCAAVILLDRWFLNRRRFVLGLAAVLYFLAFFAAEFFLLVLTFSALVITYLLTAKYKLAKTTRLAYLLGALAIPAAYASLYVTWSLYWGGSYRGTELSVPQLTSVLEIIKQWSLGAFSLYYLWLGDYPVFYVDAFGHDKISLIPPLSWVDVLAKAKAVDVVVGILAGGLAVVAAHFSSKIMPWKGCMGIAVFGTVAAFLVLVLYGVSGHYPGQLESSRLVYLAYLSSRHAYLAWVLVIVASFVCFLRLCAPAGWLRPSMLAGFGLILTYSSLASSYLNEQVADSMRVNMAKWKAVDAALSCKTYRETMRSRTIFAPRLGSRVWWTKPRAHYWTQYASNRLDHPIVFNVDNTVGSYEPEVFFDFRIGAKGELIAVVLAERNGRASFDEVLTLTRRDSAVQVFFEADGQPEMEILSWGTGSVSCGEFGLTRLRASEIDPASLVFFAPPAVVLNNPH